ncbi:MAG: hypothetical protein FJ280_15240 [Planctomycetes bacterium]|nr:hypothetical protein [Planctomycetota bacterium]
MHFRIPLAAWIVGWIAIEAGTCPAQTDLTTDLKSDWRLDAPHEFHEAALPGLGFSFVYDGRQIGPLSPTDWRVEGNAAGQQITFRHTSGLTVIRQVRTFRQFGALEYSVRFKNNGTNVLRRLIRDRYASTIAGKPVTGSGRWFEVHFMVLTKCYPRRSTFVDADW